MLGRVGLSKLVMPLYPCLCGAPFLNFVKSDVGVVPKDNKFGIATTILVYIILRLSLFI